MEEDLYAARPKDDVLTPFSERLYNILEVIEKQFDHRVTIRPVFDPKMTSMPCLIVKGKDGFERITPPFDLRSDKIYKSWIIPLIKPFVPPKSRRKKK